MIVAGMEEPEGEMSELTMIFLKNKKKIFSHFKSENSEWVRLLPPQWRIQSSTEHLNEDTQWPKFMNTNSVHRFIWASLVFINGQTIYLFYFWILSFLIPLLQVDFGTANTILNVLRLLSRVIFVNECTFLSYISTLFGAGCLSCRIFTLHPWDMEMCYWMCWSNRHHCCQSCEIDSGLWELFSPSWFELQINGTTWPSNLDFFDHFSSVPFIIVSVCCLVDFVDYIVIQSAHNIPSICRVDHFW